MNLIKTVDLSVQRQDHVILDKINLTLNPKEKVFLTGKVGAGKTTLLHTLMGFVPFKGELYLFEKYCQKEVDFIPFRGRKIGLLFQQPSDQLFGPTVLEDIAFGLLNLNYSQQQAHELARKQLEILNLSHLAQRSVNQLSGGEKTLTALAGILVMQPDILLLDEPSNNLDATSFERLVSCLLATPSAMLIASHDQRLITQLASREICF